MLVSEKIQAVRRKYRRAKRSIDKMKEALDKKDKKAYREHYLRLVKNLKGMPANPAIDPPVNEAEVDILPLLKEEDSR